MVSKTSTPRAVAATLLSHLLKQQGSLASLLPEHTRTLDPKAQALVKELCYGTCRWSPQLDYLLSQLLKRPLKQKDKDIHALLLTGLYQLAFMNTPDHAAIYETVKSTVDLGKPWAKQLVNGVLRQYQRHATSLLAAARQQHASAHPPWLHRAIEQAWPAQAQAIFDANNQRPPLSLRVNRQHHSRDAYLHLLAQQGIAATAGPLSPDSLYLKQAVAVETLPLFAEGAVSVQDESPQLAAHLLDLQPGLRVLDACAAPGGKTCHIAELQPELDYLLAVDKEPRRLQRLRENLARLACRAEICCGDASQPEHWWDGHLFDRILLDAPCSATGIIRRQADIKLLRQAQHIADLSQQQFDLLRALWPLLAVGGKLVYATCSILPDENTQVIAHFLNTQTDARHQAIAADWGLPQAFGRQLLPVKHRHDGFYYACLHKHAETPHNHSRDTEQT